MVINISHYYSFKDIEQFSEVLSIRPPSSLATLVLIVSWSELKKKTNI